MHKYTPHTDKDAFRHSYIVHKALIWVAHSELSGFMVCIMYQTMAFKNNASSTYCARRTVTQCAYRFRIYEADSMKELFSFFKRRVLNDVHHL